MSLMSLSKVATLTAFALVVPSAGALAQTTQPAATEPAPLRGPQWPVVPEAAQSAAAEETWTKAEIDAARARCNAVAAQYGAVFEPIDSIREGSCGTAFPVKLMKLGKITLSQPATLNCEMVAAVADWIKKDVQPAAKKILGQKITSIEVLSSYSCRNAYGRKRGRLSEHGRANALDIRGFKFERDGGVDVLAHWGMTERDIKAKIAAAEREAHKLAEADAKAKAATKAAERAQPKAIAAAPAPINSAPVHAAPAQATSSHHITAAAPSLTEQQVQQHGIGLIPSADGLSAFRGFISAAGRGVEDEPSGSTFVWGQPSRLGGPKASDDGRASPPGAKAKAKAAPRASTVDANGHSAQQRFLREIHDTACKRFGTALGPEANEAHRNHLHIDLADRGGRGSYCR
jgi:hypothetical protein